MYTYTLGDVINAASASIPRIAEEKYVDIISNATQAAIWSRFDWRETMGVVPPFWCVPDQQDYGAPAVIIPADFLGIRKAFQFNLQTYPQQPGILAPLRELDITGARGPSDAIAYNKDTQKFRLSRLPDGGMSSPKWVVSASYKKRPTKITKSNYATFPLFSDDQYFDVWVSQMKAAATKFVTTLTNKDQLLQEATIDLLKMASNEGMNLGDTPIAPAESLAGSSWGPGSGGGLWGF